MNNDDEVEFFGQRMRRDWAEMLEREQQRREYFVEGVPYRRVKYGAETFRDPVEAQSTPCRHCSTVAGQLHESRCDYEQCPKCGYQSMSCDCTYDGEDSWY